MSSISIPSVIKFTKLNNKKVLSGLVGMGVLSTVTTRSTNPKTETKKLTPEEQAEIEAKYEAQRISMQQAKKTEETAFVAAKQAEKENPVVETKSGTRTEIKEEIVKPTLESLLETEKKKGAYVEELSPGEYKITQRYQCNQGELSAVGANAEKYKYETVSLYKNNQAYPIDIIKYSHSDFFNETEPVVQRTMRNGDDYIHYIIDRGTGYGVEYRGYNANGDKLEGKEQIINIIHKDNQKIKTYTGEDIENALLVPTRHNTDNYASGLLDVKNIFGYQSSRILEWQVIDGTDFLIRQGRLFKPENFVLQETNSDNIKEYTNVFSEIPAFSKKIDEYNEYAKTRNLVIEETEKDGNKFLEFKNQNGQTVREIKASKSEDTIETDTYYKLNKSGDITQLAIKDGNNKIISRTITEYRNWWGKACTVTLDYLNGKAYTGLYFRDELTDPKTYNLEQGISHFKIVAGY